MKDAVASYNNNGTTEHSITVGDNLPTVAISYISGATVTFNTDGGVQTTAHTPSTDTQQAIDIIIIATPEGTSQNSVTLTGGVATTAESTILGTRTEIQESGEVVVDTPEVVSSLNNKITTKTT